jgi:phage terminase large subunit-like protein
MTDDRKALDILLHHYEHVVPGERMRDFTPYPFQKEFYNAGKDHPERLLMAANGVGKTWAGAYEVACHATGQYPDWWEGRTFDKAPEKIWVGSITNETQREFTQPALLGNDLGEGLGTGMIPKASILGDVRKRQCGISDVVDTVRVRHKTGGVSQLVFKTYEQGWRKWQGAAPALIWLDEEPDDFNVYVECQTRVFRSGGIILATLTPLLGQTEFTMHFTDAKAPGIYWVGATLDYAPHLKEADKERLRQSYPEHQLETRTLGVPMMGEGRVFTSPEDQIKVEPEDVLRFGEIPPYWAQIKGIDFGISHPAAVVHCAWDRDKDVFYVVDVWKKKDADSEEHAEVINKTSPWVPVAWPHDGTNREKSQGIRLKDSYIKHGVKMLGISARYKKDKGGSQPKEPVIMEIQQRSKIGGFKVFSTCHDFFTEYRNYHRKDGKVVDRLDDILSATFYAMMMRRYAVTAGSRFQQQQAPTRPILSM